MNFLVYLSNFCIPLLLFYMIAYGLLTKTDIYKEFTEGAKDGFQVTLGILPTLIGLMTGVGMLRASGFLELLSGLLKPAAEALFFPAELVPLVVVKLFSSSAATGLVLDIFETYGPDSLLGKTVSILCSSTETVFYTMSVYLIAAKVKKARWTLAGGLISTLVGIVASIWVAQWV